MLRSFKQLAGEPDAPLKPLSADARDVVAWLRAAQVKLSDAQQTVVSAGTRMDAAWDAVLLACLAVACAQGWRATSDKGHPAAVFEGAAQAMGLGQNGFDALDALRDWRNRKYRAGQFSTPAEVEEAIALVTPFQADVASWFADRHPMLIAGHWRRRQTVNKSATGAERIEPAAPMNPAATAPPDNAIELLALGEAMIEFNQTGERDGRLWLQGFGGDTSNFAIAAARQGTKAGYLSALGGDAHGRMLRALWAREGVDASGVKSDASAYTAIYFVSHDAEGHRFDFMRAGSAASRMTPAELPRERISAARVLHLSGISLAISASACETGLAAIATARGAGVRVSFDTNLRLKLWPLARARAVMREAMSLADICLPSLDDMTTLTGLVEPEAIVDHCLRLGAHTVALKLGAAGALVADAARRFRIAPHPCHAVDATGAGDTFGGAFVARLLAGDTIAAAGRYAAVAAALSTEGFGAVQPIPTAARVRAALERDDAARPADAT